MNCSKCPRLNLSKDDFNLTPRGSRYSYCKECRKTQVNAARRKRYQRDDVKRAKLLNAKQKRQNPVLRANIIAIDSKASDKKHNREYGLTIEKINELISQPCSYCEETELQMTLDRIDNSIGHIESNVVPACVRCNLIRKAMPYGAWICLLPGLREARKKGFLENG